MNELYLRAARNLGEQRAQRMRMPIEDTLAGQVVRTGKPIRLDKASAGAALKVKTGFLVRAILQVPLTVGNTVIGVLAVDNQQAERTFSGKRSVICFRHWPTTPRLRSTTRGCIRRSRAARSATAICSQMPTT